MPDYSREWRDYRNRRNLTILGLLWFVASPVLIPCLLAHTRLGEGWSYVALIASSFVAVLPLVWLLLFRCPRCGLNFTLRGPWAQNMVARKCEKCGLQKYANE